MCLLFLFTFCLQVSERRSQSSKDLLVLGGNAERKAAVDCRCSGDDVCWGICFHFAGNGDSAAAH